MTNSLCDTCGKPADVCVCTGQAEQDWRSQLDSIPTPGAGKTAAQPAPAAPKSAGPGLKDQLDAIPEPGAGKRPTAAATPSGLSLKEQLDSIPDPGAPKPPAEPAGLSLKDQLDSIPDPGSGASGVRPAPAASGKEETPQWMKNYDNARSSLTGAPDAVTDVYGLDRSALESIPTPGAGGAAGAAPGGDGEVPQWMKNFESHKSAATARGGAMPNPDSYVPRGDAPPTNNSFQAIAIVFLVITALAVGYLIQNGKPLDPSQLDKPASSSATPAQ